jgi:hypothetical protein
MKKIMLIILALIVLSVGVFANADLKMEDLIIPEAYSELVKAYKSIASVAISYQRLYRETEQAIAEAEADNQTLLKVIENLQSLLKVQQDIIDELLRKNRFSIFAGVDYVPLHPDYSGLTLGLNWEF